MSKGKKRWVIVALCFAAAVLVYVGACTFALVRDNIRAEQGLLAVRHLALEDFEWSGIKLLSEDDGKKVFVTTDDDAKLIYEQETAFYPGVVTFKAAANKPTGEIALYYSASPGQIFNERHKLWAEQNTDGDWFFDLGGRKAYALRLDPDSLGGVEWQMEWVSVGGRQTPMAYFALTPLRVFLLLTLPMLLAALLLEGLAIVQPLCRTKNAAGKQSGSV